MLVRFFDVIECVEIILEDADEQIILSLVIDPVLRKVELLKIVIEENVPSLKLRFRFGTRRCRPCPVRRRISLHSTEGRAYALIFRSGL